MKYNEKQFYQSVTEPFEVQEMEDGSKVSLHYMNDEPFFMDNINKGSFSVWSCGDAKNYKIFIERGIYDVTKDLYTPGVNEIWMNFLSSIDKMRKKYIFCVMLPMLLVFITGLVLLSIFFPNKAWILFVALIFVLIASLVASAMLSRKMQIENINAAAKVRDFVGIDKFKGIVEDQDKYMEKFYDDLQKKYDEEDRLSMEENQESVDVEENIEETETEVIDEVETNENTESNEDKE